MFEVVLEAGGFTEDADQEAVALWRATLSDGCTVDVPLRGETESAGSRGFPPSPRPGSPGAGLRGLPQEARQRVPCHSTRHRGATRIRSPGSARRWPSRSSPIVKTQGPFTSVDQLTDVPGIGPAKLEQLRPLVGL